MIKFRSVKRT